VEWPTDFDKMAQKVVHFRTLNCIAMPSFEGSKYKPKSWIAEFMNQTVIPKEFPAVC
jgi:hypothetical protein